MYGSKETGSYQDENSDKKFLDAQCEAQITDEIEESRKCCQDFCSNRLECSFDKLCSASVAASIAGLCSLL